MPAPDQDPDEATSVPWLGLLASAIGAGVLFGAASTMRTEALVYLVVATAVLCLTILVVGRRLLAAVAVGVVFTLRGEFCNPFAG